MIKLNWGYRITILYVGFAGLIIFLVWSSMNQKIDLVSNDYYARELVYQDKMESIERNNQLSDPAVIYWNTEGIRIEYPAEFKPERISGTVNIFRPSDKNLDVSVEAKADADHIQVISGEKLAKGMYRVNVDYEYENLSYYTEKQIVVR